MFKNVAAKFIVFAFDATTNVPKTGDAANITAYVSKDYGSVTVLADTSAAEMESTNAPGYYLFDAAQGETNADCLMVSAKSTTSNIKVVGAPAVIFTRPTTGWLAPVTAGRTLVVDAAGLADANVVKVGPTGSGSAQTARDIGASVLLSNGTGTGQVKLASGYVAMTWGDISGATSSVNLSGTTIKAVTDPVSITSNIKKNQALSNIDFVMTDSTNHNPTTGLTVSILRAIDSGAFAAGGLSAVTEVSNGHYRFDAAQADMNGNVITFKATATGADDKSFTIFTTP